MTIDQQQKMLTTQRLILNRKRLFEHYEVPVYMGLPMTFGLGAYVYMQWQDGFTNLIGPKLMMPALPVMGILIFFNQYRALRLHKIETGKY